MKELVFMIRTYIEDKMDEIILQTPKFKQTKKILETQEM